MALIRAVYANFAAFPGTGTTDVIYIDASNDNQYLWNGTTYVSYAPEPIGVLLGHLPDAWFTANPEFILGNGQIVYLSDGVDAFSEAYKIGDGKTDLQTLSWKNVKPDIGAIETEINDLISSDGVQNGRLDNLEANSINKNGDNNIQGIFNCEPGVETLWRGSFVDPGNTFLNISTFALLDDGTSAMTFYSEDPSTFMTLAVGSVDFRNNRTRMYFGGMSYNSTIEARENSIKLSGNSPSFALEYADDYSSNFTGNHRAIPDLAYIQSIYQPQIDAIVSGLSWKNACRAATTADITLSGLQTVDGVSLIAGDRCLVKNQSASELNGIYIVSAGAWTRATDFNTASQMPSSTVAIIEGTVNQDKQYVCTNDLPITVGTTAINFVLVGGTTYVGTAGRITVTGNVIDVGNDVALKTYADAKVEDNLTDSTTVAPSKTAVNTAIATKLDVELPSTTGTALTFETDRVYGSIASPETGNITFSTTNAKVGVTNIIIHNSGSAPTFAANMRRLSGSGLYMTSVINYIYVTYINATEVVYSINQRT